MRIGLWFHATVPVRRYGGTQRVVVWLADALAELGHEPVLLTPPGSRSRTAEVVALPKRVVRRAESEPAFELDAHLPPGLDILHFHSVVAARTAVPRLTTIHGNGEPGSFGPDAVFVSRDHMERMGGSRYVLHGLPPDACTYRERKRDWLLFLAKVRWKVKGVDRAERVARAAGVPLVIAGGWRLHPFDRSIRSVGMVGGERKRELLADARALLFPVRWEEPFGLAVIEALASGTPVLASQRGSLPELVSPETGFLCDSEEAFVEAVAELDRIEPAACRARVEARFTARRMAEDYLRLYREAAGSGRRSPEGDGGGA
jgi:glycosyltransferase involved in cell wall biosynthesis